MPASTDYRLALVSARMPIVAEAIFSPDHLAFQGHFPGNPILPAFVQVQVALDTLKAAGAAHVLREVVVAKFVRSVPPEAKITITVVERDEVYDAELRAGGEIVSTFTLRC